MKHGWMIGVRITTTTTSRSTGSAKRAGGPMTQPCTSPDKVYRPGPCPRSMPIWICPNQLSGVLS